MTLTLIALMSALPVMAQSAAAEPASQAPLPADTPVVEPVPAEEVVVEPAVSPETVSAPEQPEIVPAPEPEAPSVPEQKPVQGSTLYVQLPSESDPRFQKVRAIVNMFPGEAAVKVFFADTRKLRGAKAALDSRMIQELNQLLGESNVVVK
jgi:outer membrane biosynthesis protein TonB